MSISLVVPTLNAGRELGALLDSVLRQTHVPDDILIIDSASEDNTLDVARSYPEVRTMCIRREDFNHGGTRQLALENVSGDFVFFLTQDAIPADDNYIANLLAPFEDTKVALASGRQLPKDNARRYVQLIQDYNYPAESNTRSVADVERLGIKAFFASDTCSAYRRVALNAIGGIPSPCDTNEDMLAAARLLYHGYKVAYVADAKVTHSHNFSLLNQFNRNRRVGEFLQKYGSELKVPSEIGEGVSLYKYVNENLLSEESYIEIIRFTLDCLARFLGNRVGRLL